MAVCFCTLAVHGPYRQRARLLCGDLPSAPWVVLTDQPADFSDLPVRAVPHRPTGPMAIDYRQHLAHTGNGNGAAAYHDKRFALQAALQEFDTAIFFDADSRIDALPPISSFPAGLAVIPVVRKSVLDHLETCGAWRLPAFAALARELLIDADALRTARWCHETCYAVTKDGREDRFFAAWGLAADFLQRRGVYSGEGGVMGLAAACVGWPIDYETLAPLGALIQHEGGGPKQ
jgi:hypothetical protein